MPAHAPCRRPLSLAALLLAALTVAPRARALDKQGSAHGGTVSGGGAGLALSGGLMLGASLYNPSYAARPDNSGLALMRYAAHADLDLVGRRLSIPLDLNLFTDKERDGAARLSPTELDIIAGLTSTWELGPGALELGARFEHDRPLDRPGATQSYVDSRARYLYSLAAVSPGFAARFPRTDVSGWLTLGWFIYNPSYFARPDNTGRALLRYAVHVELSVLDDLLSVGADATMFTDRTAANPVRPSELDLTPELIFHQRAFEVHLAYEIDMPLDRGGLVQRYLYLLGVFSFSLLDDEPVPLDRRGHAPSP